MAIAINWFPPILIARMCNFFGELLVAFCNQLILPILIVQIRCNLSWALVAFATNWFSLWWMHKCANSFGGLAAFCFCFREDIHVNPEWRGNNFCFTIHLTVVQDFGPGFPPHLCNPFNLCCQLNWVHAIVTISVCVNFFCYKTTADKLASVVKRVMC